MNFTAKDVVAIIKAMHGTSILLVEFEGLVISCGPKKEEEELVQMVRKPGPEYPQHLIDCENHQDMEMDDHVRSQKIKDEMDADPMLFELERQNLMIQDPAAFEEMMDREDQDAEERERTEQPVSKGRPSPDDSLRRTTHQRVAGHRISPSKDRPSVKYKEPNGNRSDPAPPTYKDNQESHPENNQTYPE